MNESRTLLLGLSVSPYGHHPAAWRRPGATSDALESRRVAAQVLKAQAGLLDFVLFADALAHLPVTVPSPQALPFEPTTLVAALATIAGRIGFIATAATGQHELYNLARRFASLDLISRGRVGWNVVPTGNTDAWDAEYVSVVGALWESWDADAFVYDKPSGQFFLPDKMHVLQHRGEHFTVRGPLNVNPSPQGRPVLATVLHAATLPVAVRSAEVVFISGLSPPAQHALLPELRRLESGGARPRSRVLANVVPWLGATRAEARDLCDSTRALALPDPARRAAAGLPGAAQMPDGFEVAGTAIDVADALQEAFENSAIDGFTVLPPVAPGGLDAFVDGVVPELRRRGLVRSGYQGISLRERLSLVRPGTARKA